MQWVFLPHLLLPQLSQKGGTKKNRIWYHSISLEEDLPENLLKLHTNHLQTIQTHAESTYPEECCGLLLGLQQGDAKTLIEVLPTENSWNDEAADTFGSMKARTQLPASRRNRFTIAPAVMLKAQKNARNRHLDIIGIYHSHPDHPAVPSEFDRAIAWQQYSYIIVSVQQGEASDFKSWSLDEDNHFQPEEIITLPINRD